MVALIRPAGAHRMVDVTLSDGSVLHSTDGHPIWDATTKKFTTAADLHVGDDVLGAGGSRATIVRLTVHRQNLTAYNLQIDTIHTYYAGTSPILVHDSCGDMMSRPQQIADRFNATTRQVKDAIHAAKRQGLPRNGPVRNPDLSVDTNTGEIYPQLPDGGYGDSIGNLWDYLEGGG
ncbi:polymorphic toxin-type HINT domain-containing protein [Phycicoccus sp. M110.8]|uniref:polymorphic toxin-type HINT domain-containing protein n=1 Tax=Phycicoccus sp. M110.8 TaxID=3075433 RepID=UPI0028FD48C2|nr:polymorphic toxin-type HINT domain-containing protein [Phycicoccus sp. M110.8]MDU0314111.1 polymorphic toxin-type HINT domain-containing protein [Phycicoccus sp. M110.8]